MTTKSKLIIGAIALITAFAFGRFSAPEKIKIETKIVEVEKKSTKESSDKEKHKKTTTITITRPDGTKETKKVVQDDTVDKKKSSETDSKFTKGTQSKEITSTTSKTTVQALGAYNILKPSLPSPIDFGIMVSRPVLGPITIGVFGFRSGVAGCGVGLTF